jgi:polysaccharide pyruvyl transferase WcaK-like protein
MSIGHTKQPRSGSIFLLGHFGMGNMGNEVTLASMIRFLRRTTNGERVVVVCPHPSRAEHDHGESCIPIRWQPSSWILRALNRLSFGIPVHLGSFVRALLKMRSASVLIVPGTGVLDDFGEGPLGTALWLFTWCQAAKLLRRPILMVSVGAGPILHPLSRLLMTSAASAATYRSFRDGKSRAYMHSLGVNTRGDPIFPDLAFGEEPFQTKPSFPLKSSPVIGLGLMDYAGWRHGLAGYEETRSAYLEKIVLLVDLLLLHGCSIRLIIGDEQDVVTVDYVMERLRRGSRTLIHRVTNSEIVGFRDVLSEVEKTDILIATRFHNLVAGILLGRPSISLGYAPKNDELLRKAGMSEFCQNVETFDVETVLQQVRRLSEEGAFFVQGLAEMVDAARRQLYDQEALLARFIDDRAPCRELRHVTKVQGY